MKRLIYTSLLVIALLGTPPLQAQTQSVLDDTPFVSPTELFVLAHGLDTIKEGFKINGVSYKFHKLFEEAQSKERLGFFGYHGSCRDYRIFQDLIRIGIEEVLKIPIRSDFHFLRVPGDVDFDLEGASDFLKLYVDIFDLSSDQKAKLISLQIALYNECIEYSSGSCPTEYFTNNASLTKVKYPGKLKGFFRMLGIAPNKVNEAFTIARNLLPNDRGILLQFFDLSHLSTMHPYYDLLDRHAYASRPLGIPVTGAELPSHYIWRRDLFDYPQLRLVISNRHILNPNSHLQIKRYDGIDKATIKKYERALREFYNNQKVKAAQKKRYREQLQALWN